MRLSVSAIAPGAEHGLVGLAVRLQLGVVERGGERVVAAGRAAAHLLDEDAHDLRVELRPGVALELLARGLERHPRRGTGGRRSSR